MHKELSLTEGPIFSTLFKFSLPVIVAYFLQSLYGAVDLIVVGRFATTADVSGVSTGSMLMMMITQIVAGLSVGATILIGHRIGENDKRGAGKAVGSAVVLFLLIALILIAIIIPSSRTIVSVLNAPIEAFDQTLSYIRICCWGFVFITAYNLIGAIFRGIGDSKTPLITVSVSCVLNIFCDVLFVKRFNMGARGAALATVISQAISVVTSLIFIRKSKVQIELKKQDIRLDKKLVSEELKLGVPIALQDFLVSLSFLVIMAVVNKLGLIASAGMGVGEKVCAFIMLIPSSFAQGLTAFVAQNDGAGFNNRCEKGLFCGIGTSFAMGLVMFFLAFFYGDYMAKVFDRDKEVIIAAHSYLKAYAIDCTLTPIMFCFVGYFNGYRKTTFCMIQGLLSAFFIRVPLAIIFGKLPNASLFLIGLSTPCATFTQIFMNLWMYRRLKNNQ